MQQAIPAAIAFFALGAVFLGSLLLVLFNPRSRSVRWGSLLQLGIMVWLAAQGAAFSTGDFERFHLLLNGSVNMLPAFFLAFTLVREWNLSAWRAAAIVGLGAALLPLTLGFVLPVWTGTITAVWHICGWGSGTLVQARRLRRRLPAQRGDRPTAPPWLAPAVGVLLLIVAPAVLAGSLVFGSALFYYAMPLIVVWLQIVTFVGVAYLRFYDIEVRASRTGELLSGAAEVERMAVVGELAASLAHEIRNPLTGVRSLAQRLAEEEIDEAKRRRYANVIIEETGRVERLVANLLGVARRSAPGRPGGESTSVRPLLDDLLLLMEARARRRGVSFDVGGGDPVVVARREPLAQVLLNVMINAVQHSPSGAAVTIELQEGDGRVAIRIRNLGSGFPPEERERVWEAFHSTSGGTGLGLAVVRRIAREEGWEVSLDSSPEAGVEFRLELPAGMSPASPPPPARLRAAETAR